MIARRVAHCGALPYAVSLLLVLPTAAAGLMIGIAGYSGKVIIQGEPLYCSDAGTGCHVADRGAQAPLVSFEGPTQVDPGAVATYTFVVTSQNPQVQIKAGFDVAASGGTLGILPDQQEQNCGGLVCSNGGPEITHTGPKDNDPSGVARWQFTWTAPTAPGSYVLFGAGNSVDGSSTQNGDKAQITTMMINVGTAPTPTPTPIAAVCTGDCNGDRMVSISELITCVNIDLGSVALSSCPVCSSDGRTVVISDLIAAVNRALNGC